MKLTAELILRNETPGACRYEETGYKDNPTYAFGTLYIRKAALPKPFPQAIVVTVESK